jgi:hypothetical protein
MNEAVNAHLRRLLRRLVDIIRDEVANCASLAELYPEMGDIHPALCRERHVQNLMAQGARQAGYFTLSECNYFVPASEGRRIDLGLWITDVRQWLYLELEPCGPLFGYQGVLADAQKLVADVPKDVRDQLRSLVVYGFRDRVKERDYFPDKYEELSEKLGELGFKKIEIRRCQLDSPDYTYFQAGLWVL